MSIRKRISQILTPSIRRTSPEVETGFGLRREIGGAARIGDILRRLLVDNNQDAESIQTELSDLRDIASKYGCYLIACEIQECVSSMPNEDEDGRAFKKGRGFELAANLYQQNISKRINAVNEGDLNVEPEEFSRYVRELLECLFLAKKHRRGIQVCIEICEYLVLRGCDLSIDRHLFLSLAKDSAVTILELSLHVKEKADREYNRAKRESREFDTPIPDYSFYPDGVDEEILSHLDGLARKIAEVADSLSETEAKAKRDSLVLAPKFDEATVANHLSYLEIVRNISNKAQYLPLEAFSYEQTGKFKESMQPGDGQEFVKVAAQLFERQAIAEGDLGLDILSRQHYVKAEEFWRLGGDVSRAENAGTIASNLPTPKTRSHVTES